MSKVGDHDSAPFEISYLSKAGAQQGIKTYERMGFERVSVRADGEDGRIWVTFRAKD